MGVDSCSSGGLRDAGFEPEEHRRAWGAARAFVHTPGGHLVEFMEYPPVR